MSATVQVALGNGKTAYFSFTGSGTESDPFTPGSVTATPATTGPGVGTNAARVVEAAHDYETVAASATDQVMGGTGAIGDTLTGVLIIPATTAAGAVSIKDGSGSAITIFDGGAVTALSSLIPFFVPLGDLRSASGAWKISTGANVRAIGIGYFSA